MLKKIQGQAAKHLEVYLDTIDLPLVQVWLYFLS